MAIIDKKISELPLRETLTGNEEIPFAENGENGKVKSSLLKGLKGESGVHVGTEEPTDDSNVWIDPNGNASGEFATVNYVDNAINNALTTIENGTY